MADAVPAPSPAASKHVDSEAVEAWVATQQKTFTKWMNNHLKKKGYAAITDATIDFETGVKLMQIINALYNTPIPKHNGNPKLRPHKLDNIEQALKMVDDAKVKTNFLKPSHLIDHDTKMILGMMWSIILDFAIKGISEDDTSAKEGLLLWCRKKTAGYREIDPPTITNFTSNWRNGLAFCALIHKHQPHLIDYDSLDKNNAADNLELAFSVGESLGIPRLLDVEDVNVEKPDERSIMTQVAEYFHRFAQQDVKEVAARRAANFLAFAKSINQTKSEYEEQAKALLAWVQSVIERFQNEQLGESLEEAQAAIDRLRQFVLDEKPPKSAEKIDVESKYAEIQQKLLVNDRPAYECPAELTPESIDAAFDSLWDAEKTYAAAARAKRLTSIKKEEHALSAEKVQEIKDSYDHFDTDKDGRLDKQEFKAALSALSIPIKDDLQLDALFAKVAQGDKGISAEHFIAYVTEQAQDKDTPEQIISAFKTLADERESISADGLRVPPLTSEDVDFLSTNMPQHANGGLDYTAFVNSSFRQ